MKLDKFYNPNSEFESIHYCDEIINAFDLYKFKKPLNSITFSEKELLTWENKFKLNIFEYALILKKLFQSDNIDDFINSYSIDFDNLAPIIESAIESKILSVDAQNNIHSTFLFNSTFLEVDENTSINNFKPNPIINQFPCTLESRKKRLEFIKSRFPFCNYLRISLIGDDDLLSYDLRNESWLHPVIYDTDDCLLDIIERLSDRFTIKNINFCKLLQSDNWETIGKPQNYTFLTDPPYTQNGILLFILAGLHTIEIEENHRVEFYVIINPSIIGRNLNLVFKLLNESNIYLKEIIESFSNYDLPFHYDEYTRANVFSNYHKFKVPKTSSTSNLYIFQTENPNLNTLKNSIESNLIYEHYH